MSSYNQACSHGRGGGEKNGALPPLDPFVAPLAFLLILELIGTLEKMSSSTTLLEPEEFIWLRACLQLITLFIIKVLMLEN